MRSNVEQRPPLQELMLPKRKLGSQMNAHQRSQNVLQSLKSSLRGHKVDEMDPRTPREGDTLIQLSTSSKIPLEDRMDLLGYSFAKIVQGAILRTIVRWDLKDGCIEFIVGGGPATPGPRGKVEVALDDIPDTVKSQVAPVKEA